MHIKLLSATATAPSTGAAATAVSGDSLTVENGKGKIRIISMWAVLQTAGFAQIAFPSGHDSTRGFRMQCATGHNIGLLPLGIALPVQAQETLSITIAGSATAGDVEQVYSVLHYEDLPGINQKLLTDAQLHSRFEKLTNVDVSITSTAGPSYGTPVALAASADLLLANREYAVLGVTNRAAAGAAYLVGPDTGNVRVGVPGDILKPEITSQFFPLLSRVTGLPCIPVINSGNKASTFFGVSHNENSAAMNLTWALALLK